MPTRTDGWVPHHRVEIEQLRDELQVGRLELAKCREALLRYPEWVGSECPICKGAEPFTEPQSDSDDITTQMLRVVWKSNTNLGRFGHKPDCPRQAALGEQK